MILIINNMMTNTVCMADIALDFVRAGISVWYDTGVKREATLCHLWL